MTGRFLNGRKPGEEEEEKFVRGTLRRDDDDVERERSFASSAFEEAVIYASLEFSASGDPFAAER